jgi:hypothetical protein
MIRKRLICLALVLSGVLAASLALAASFPWVKSVKENAYFDGRAVEYSPDRAHWGEKLFRIGPWDIGPMLASREKNDKRPNLYVVVPGSARSNSSSSEYNHNLVLSAIPKTDEASDFDVYWAVVLDPNLKEDIRAETQLLLAAQEPFAPDQDFQFDNVPSHAFLHAFLHIDSLDQLAEYKRPDGSLPKVAIIAARFAIRAKIADPEARTQETAKDPDTR